VELLRFNSVRVGLAGTVISVAGISFQQNKIVVAFEK